MGCTVPHTRLFEDALSKGLTLPGTDLCLANGVQMEKRCGGHLGKSELVEEIPGCVEGFGRLSWVEGCQRTGWLSWSRVLGKAPKGPERWWEGSGGPMAGELGSCSCANLDS